MTTASPADRRAADAAEALTFKPTRQLRWTAIMCALFFPAATVGGIWLSLANPDGSFKKPVAFAVVCGTVFGGFSLVAAWMLLATRRLRVVVSDAGIRVVTAFTDRTIAWDEITRARWRRYPQRGSLVLRSAPNRRFVIDFENFQRRRELSDLLRARVPANVQENYDVYERVWLKPRKPPPVITPTAALRLAVASLAIAVAFRLTSHVPFVRQLVALPLFFCPALALACALDCVRRPSARIAIATAVAIAAVAIVLSVMWPAMRTVMG